MGGRRRGLSAAETFVVRATSSSCRRWIFGTEPRSRRVHRLPRPGAVLRPTLGAARGDMSSARASPTFPSIAGGCPGVPRDRTRARPRGIPQTPRPPSWSSRHRRAASLDPDVASTSARTEVFVACVPLVGLEALGAALGDAYPAPLEHTMVLVRHPGVAVATAYDFLPSDPTNPATAAALFGGGSVPGECRVRPLRGVPSRRCWCVGYAAIETPDAVDDAAASFQTAYDARLRLAGNSCREHTAALATALVGRPVRLEEVLAGRWVVDD